MFEKLIINNDSKNKKQIKKLTIKFKIKKIVVLKYHFQTNDIIEKNHKLIVNALIKIINEKILN